MCYVRVFFQELPTLVFTTLEYSDLFSPSNNTYSERSLIVDSGEWTTIEESGCELDSLTYTVQDRFAQDLDYRSDRESVGSLIDDDMSDVESIGSTSENETE